MNPRIDTPADRSNIPHTFWQPAGVVYLGFCLAGLAAGMWPGRLVPLCWADSPPSPTLQTLAVAQVFFFLLVYPIVLLKRQERNMAVGSGQSAVGTFPTAECLLPTANFSSSESRTSHSALCTSSSAPRTPHYELTAMFLATAPLYFLAAWLGDAAAKDVCRAILAVAGVCPLGVVAGRLLVKPAWRSGVMLTLLLIVLGLPGAWYICEDFLGVSSDWAEQLSPLLFVWQAAASREPHFLPQPLWAWLAWPILAAVVGVGLWMFGRKPA